MWSAPFFFVKKSRVLHTCVFCNILESLSVLIDFNLRFCFSNCATCFVIFVLQQLFLVFHHFVCAYFHLYFLLLIAIPFKQKPRELLSLQVLLCFAFWNCIHGFQKTIQNCVFWKTQCNYNQNNHTRRRKSMTTFWDTHLPLFKK